jgi:hypothetical protein
MKKFLTGSILLNVTLIICLLALLKQRNPGFGPPASDIGKTNEIALAEPANNEASSATGTEPVEKQSAPEDSSQSLEVVSRSEHPRPKEQPILMPLVFQNVDLAQLNLNPDQLQAVEDLRRRFVDEIGGLQQNPTDPAYREKWVRSQPGIDNDLRGMIGITAFQDYQIIAADLTVEPQKTGSSLR